MTGGAPDSLRLAARAKVNLYLHVVGRRGDGYHLLDSLVVFTGLADSLEIKPSSRLTLAVQGPFAADIGPVEDNLILRAARALREAAGMAGRGAEILLDKNIPAVAGLGGGSADAAAALGALARLWEVPVGAVDLPALAMEIGADVPVCLAGGPSFVGGAGEKIEPAPDLPRAGLLLVNPGIQVATQAVFAVRRGGFSPSGQFSDPVASVADLAALLAERDNDLTEAATRLAPAIGDVIDALAGLPGCRLARMSGSGATCFGLFDTAEAAVAAAPAVRRDGWWVEASEMARPD